MVHYGQGDQAGLAVGSRQLTMPGRGQLPAHHAWLWAAASAALLPFCCVLFCAVALEFITSCMPSKHLALSDFSVPILLDLYPQCSLFFHLTCSKISSYSIFTFGSQDHRFPRGSYCTPEFVNTFPSLISHP